MSPPKGIYRNAPLWKKSVARSPLRNETELQELAHGIL